MNKNPFWIWAGRLALVAVPAAISGFASYAKARTEAESNSAASYEAMKTAVTSLQKDHDEDHDRIFKLEGEYATLRDLCAFPETRPFAPAPPVPKKELVHKKSIDLPERYDDMVQKYESKAKK